MFSLNEIFPFATVEQLTLKLFIMNLHLKKDHHWAK